MYEISNIENTKCFKVVDKIAIHDVANFKDIQYISGIESVISLDGL